VEEANLIAVVVRRKMRVVEEDSIGKKVFIASFLRVERHLPWFFLLS